MKVHFKDLRRTVVAVDPAATSHEESDDTGIVVVARGPHQDETCKIMEAVGRCPGHGYVLADLTCHVKPHEWAKRAVKAYDIFQADKIVAEVNNGGDMVEETVRAVRLGVPYKEVRASRGKRKRAQPVAALWEQGRMHFVSNCPELVDQMTSWNPDEDDDHDDRIDALVWGMTALGLLGGQGDAFMQVWRQETRDRKVINLAEKRQEKIKRDLMRLVSRKPHLGMRPQSGDDIGLDRLSRDQMRCEHRIRDEACLVCSASRVAIEAATK